MIRSFQELENQLKASGTVGRVAVACAADAPVLESVVEARKKGIARGILIGRETAIRAVLADMGEPAEDYTIQDCDGEAECAALAATLLREGKADAMMKGLMQTSAFMRAILDKEKGLVPKGNVVSEITVVDIGGRILCVTDCAINPAPDREAKVKLARNACGLLRCFGVTAPKVALISAVEKPTPKIPSTVDAAAIAQERIEGCEVDGPMDFVTALDEKAAAHKGIVSPVAGRADVLIMPDLCTGNIFHKMLGYWTNFPYATAVSGTSKPVVLTSRADSAEVKYNSLLTALGQSL